MMALGWGLSPPLTLSALGKSLLFWTAPVFPAGLWPWWVAHGPT